VADTMCSNCEESLGVKYIEAPSGKNAFKIGAYLIEKPKLQVVSYVGKTPKSLLQQGEKAKGKQKNIFTSLFSFLKK